MLIRSGIIAAAVLFSSVSWAASAASAREAADPSREQLQHMLMTPKDLEGATQVPWYAKAIVVREASGPAGTADSSGCPDLDNAVLATNYGLTDSGAQPFVTNMGDQIEETVVYDQQANAHVQQLDKAIESCPVMTFSDGPQITVKPIELGGTVAGFRAFIGGYSRSAVLTASEGDYVVELIVSDRGYPDEYFQSLVKAATFRVANPN